MTPLEFLNMLWGAKPADLHILIWARNGERSHWFREAGAAATFVATNNSDIYVGVGLSGCDYGVQNRCSSDKVAGIAGFWADFDLGSEAHSKKPLPTTIEDALSLIPERLPPTIIIATGNGVHVWWLFHNPWIFGNDADREAAATLSYRFQTLLRCLSNQRGWAFERLADLARILRIPGTVNAKDVNNPKPVEVYSIEGRRYAHSDFIQYLDDLSIPDEKGEERAAKETAQHFTDEPLVINFGATVPAAMLATWMESDTRFRHTWNRERHDLPDQSGSGYDLALACFGSKAGFSDQQIVDLIVHHRRIHSEQRRTRADYYQRAISKARRSTECLDRPMPGVATLESPIEQRFPPSGCAPEADGHCPNAADPIRRATLCDQISRALGVHIIRLSKVTGKEPVFLMELEEGNIEFDIAKLISQKSVGLALAGKVGKIIPKFSPPMWKALAQKLLDACTVIVGTEDLELEGAARIQIEKYLNAMPLIASLEDVGANDRYRPIVDKARIAISATHMQDYINRTTTQNVSVRAVAGMLASIGAQSVRVRGQFKEQGRWALPLGEFDPKDYTQANYEDDGHAE